MLTCWSGNWNCILIARHYQTFPYGLTCFTALWRQWSPTSMISSYQSFKAEARPGKPSSSISMLIFLCIAPMILLHCNLPLQLALQCSNRNTHMHQFFAEQGLSQDQTLVNGIFFCPAPLASTKTALLQFVTIHLAAFIPLVPPVETETGNNWLESTMEKHPSFHWDKIIYRIVASVGEVLRLSFGPHTLGSWSFPLRKLLAWNKVWHSPQCCNII